MGFYWLHWASSAQLLQTHPWDLWACHQSPSLFACIALSLSRSILTFFSHHTLPMGLLLAISLFLGSFEPICFLKAYLLISWTCDPLFLLLGLNGFCSLSFANFFLVCVAGLGFLPFIWISQKKDPQQIYIDVYIHSSYFGFCPIYIQSSYYVFHFYHI